MKEDEAGRRMGVETEWESKGQDGSISRGMGEHLLREAGEDKETASRMSGRLEGRGWSVRSKGGRGLWIQIRQYWRGGARDASGHSCHLERRKLWNGD